MNKLLREVPTIQSWLGGSSNTFVPVTLNKDFIKKALADMKKAIVDWLKEPQSYCQSILDRFEVRISRESTVHGVGSWSVLPERGFLIFVE